MPGAAYFLMLMDNVQRAVGYIDGFNLYHAIAALEQPHLKWVDLWALVASFLREGQELTAVNYYSAYVTWMPDKFRRQRPFERFSRPTAGMLPMRRSLAEPRGKAYRCKDGR